MWSIQSNKIKQHKKRINYTINKPTVNIFKIVTGKDIKKISNVKKIKA
jgi:hypothetical protein